MRINSNYIIHAEGLDVSALQAAVKKVSQEKWDKDQLIRGLNPKPLGETRNIILAWPSNVEDPRSGNYTPDWIDWESLVQPLIDQIKSIYGEVNGGGVSRCVLAKLPSQGKVTGHYDVGGALQRAHRFHIPILTNDAMDFLIAGERVPFKVGSLIEINNQKYHQVDNNGGTDRFHLIIDYWHGDADCFTDPTYFFIPKEIEMGVDYGY